MRVVWVLLTSVLEVGMFGNQNWPWVLPTPKFLFGFPSDFVVLSLGFHWLFSTFVDHQANVFSRVESCSGMCGKSANAQQTQTCLQFRYFRTSWLYSVVAVDAEVATISNGE